MQGNNTGGKAKGAASINDFKIIAKIGEGAFGKVYLVEEIATQKQFALKCLEKSFIKEQGKDHYVFLEKLIL